MDLEALFPCHQRIKTNFPARVHRSLAFPGSPHLTTLAVIKSLAGSRNPIQSMYRGLSVNIAGNAASWGGFFYFKTHIERGLVYVKGSSSSPSASPSVFPDYEGDEEGEFIQQQQRRQPRARAAHAVDERRAKLSPADFFLSSLLAGAATALLTNPLWVLKTRLLSSERTAQGAYAGPVTGTVQMWRDEGWKGGYRGLAISMVGVAHGAVHFAVYEPAKKVYLSWRNNNRRKRMREAREAALMASGVGIDGEELVPETGGVGGVQDEKISDMATLVLSSTAKLFAGMVTYPYQVIKSRMQNYNAEERFGRGIRGVAVRVWKEEGFVGFYRGVVPSIIRVLPATWITFLVYENMKYALPRWFG